MSSASQWQVQNSRPTICQRGKPLPYEDVDQLPPAWNRAGFTLEEYNNTVRLVQAAVLDSANDAKNGVRNRASGVCPRDVIQLGYSGVTKENHLRDFMARSLRPRLFQISRHLRKVSGATCSEPISL